MAGSGRIPKRNRLATVDGDPYRFRRWMEDNMETETVICNRR
jgi:hypothetical protein